MSTLVFRFMVVEDFCAAINFLHVNLVYFWGIYTSPDLEHGFFELGHGFWCECVGR